jgi:predicted ArsR family transcriptional regulator
MLIVLMTGVVRLSVSEPPQPRRTHAALAVASRARLLDLLRSDEGARTAHDLAAAFGLHVNTVRFHLDVLEDAGLVRRENSPSSRRGRPRMLYTAAQPPATGYELLAQALAQHWQGNPAERAKRAEQAGYELAASAGDRRTGPPLSVAAAIDEVVGLFATMGFQSEIVPDRGDGAQIKLHHCPFRTVAVQHPEVVCSLHLGMIRATLSESGAPAAATGLEPFVEPNLCIVNISVVATTGPPL